MSDMLPQAHFVLESRGNWFDVILLIHICVLNLRLQERSTPRYRAVSTVASASL